MVRRTSRLPPNGKLLEEVVLQRIASGEASASAASTSTSTSTSFNTSERRKPPAAVTSSRQRTIVPSTPSAREHATVSPHPTTSSATLAHIESMATELSHLNERLVAVATTSTATSKRKTSAISSDHPARDQIDQYIAQRKTDMAAAYPTDAKHSGKTTKQLSASRTTYDPASGADVNHAVREVKSTLRRLDKVFYEVATGDKQRQLAATKISTLVRAFIVRRRFKKMKYALGQWRARRCNSMLTYLEHFAAREEFLNRQILRLDEERQRSLLRRVVTELRDVALLNLPLRLKRLDETERRFQLKQQALARMVWTAWKRSALGPRSRKAATLDAKTRHAAARRRLETLERFDVITVEMVHDEFLKENIRLIRGRHTFWVLKTYYTLFKTHEFLPLKQNTAKAIAYERKKLLKLVWRVWLPAFRAAQIDRAIAKANEHRTLDRFEKHHNLRKIDGHYRATHARKHLRAWAVYGQRIRRVRKLFEDNTKDNMAKLLQRWHIRAMYQHALRGHAIEGWQAYGRRIFQTPFRVWYNYVAARRADRRAKESICVAYQRRARRHTKYAFFRLWKHQVLFGNIEGIHSKVHLLRSLEDQKRLCLGLEQNALLYQQNIHALQQTIQGLESQLTSKQVELLAVHEATQATRFSVHSAEQSIARVQGMLEALRQLHPGTLARIEKMFIDNPLLTQDLQEVVALHVAKRQDVLDKLSLDDDELEIQHASQTPLGRDDQLLLHRVKWVLSRLDLQTTSKGHPLGHDSTRSEGAMDQLCALFEFMRSGETATLTRDNDPSHPRTAIAVVDRADVLAESETWHAFLQALTVRFAPDRMLHVKERLVKRAQEMREELHDLKANRHIYNAYNGSAHPTRDTRSQSTGR